MCPYFVDNHCRVPETLLHACLIALRKEIHQPSSDVFGSWVKVEYLVQVGMVQFAMHGFLHVRKVDNHAILVQFLAYKEEFNLPVMSMQAAALTLVAESKRMRSRYFQFL